MSTCSNKNVDDTQSSECIWLLFSCLHLLWPVTPTLLTECDFKKQTNANDPIFTCYLFFFLFLILSVISQMLMFMLRGLRTAALGCGFVL